MNKETKTLTDRIYEDIIKNNRPLSTIDIAREFLKIEKISPVLAEKIVNPILKRDGRFFLDKNSKWNIKKDISFEKLPLEEIEFVIFFISDTEKNSIHNKSNIQDYSSFVIYKSGYTNFSIDIKHLIENPENKVFIPYDTASFNSLKRYFKRIQALIPEFTTLSIKRLIGILYPQKKLKTWENIIKEFSLVNYDSNTSRAKTLTLIQIFEQILTELNKRGIKTLEEVFNLINQNKKSINFESYSFDRDFLANLPELPGVYIFEDKTGRIIYVGKTINLKKRINSYFWNTGESEEKIKNILHRLYKISYLLVGSELEAIIEEYNLIKKYKPDFNTQINVPERRIETSRRIIPLPSVEDKKLVLFILSNPRPLIKELFDCNNPENIYPILKEVMESEGYKFDAAKSLVLSYIKRYEDNLNIIEIDEYRDIDSIVEVLSNHCREFSTITSEKKRYIV